MPMMNENEQQGPVAGESAGVDPAAGGVGVGGTVSDGVTAGAAGTGGPGNRAGAAEKNHLHSWVRDMVVSVLVSAFIIMFLYQPVRVEGTSMLPMLEDQDRLFVNKLAYRVGEIHRSDVVVFLYPHDHTKSYIKRVIALPGDRLRIDQGMVYVNGQQVVEDYVPARYADGRSHPETVLPPHEYWVMGDHRSISSDSRDFGPVDRDLIYGKAAFVYWPMDQAGVVR
jgi:signal peptidase I